MNSNRKIKNKPSHLTLEESQIVQPNNTHFEDFIRAFEKSAIVTRADLSGKITYANDLLCEISGYSKEELIGQNHRLLKSNLHSKDFYKNVWSTISSGHSWHGEFCNRRKNGTYYWVNGVIFPVLDSKGIISEYVSVRFDITQQKESEESILIASKLTSLGEVAADIAHEINNPLIILSGKVDLLSQSLSDKNITDKSIQNDLFTIKKATHRIINLVKGLKAHTRNDSKDPFIITSIQEIIDDTLLLSQDRIAHMKTQLKLNIDHNLHISCHPTQISQVLLNLIHNSLDAIQHIENKWIQIDVFLEDNAYVCFSVMDSGEGISDSISEKIMKPFFSTKENGKGTGLGLSISKKVAKTHGGFFELDRTSKNTRFILKIPIAQRAI